MALECIYSRDGISESDYLECFEGFLAENYLAEVREIVFAPNETDHYGVKVCAKLLLEHDQKIGTLILFNEQEILPIFSDALIALQRRLIAEARADMVRTTRHRGSDGNDSDGNNVSQGGAALTQQQAAEAAIENATAKCNVHIRLHNLPPGFVKRNVSMISSADSGKFIEVSGTVIRTGMIKMLEAEKEFQCAAAKCGHRFRVVADLSQDGALEMPKRCPSGSACKSTNFEVVEGSRICCDYQELRIQEQMQSLSVGMIPRQILVILLNDVVDVCKAGDDITISGRLIQRWMPLREGARCEIELALLANNVSVRNDSSGIRYITDDLIDEFEQFWADARAARRCYTARNFILSSVCPQIYGACAALFVGRWLVDGSRCSLAIDVAPWPRALCVRAR
jgi:DNA replicative helicase MCM subunit Mcm2 (Cdc46/Mcm family)